MCDRERRCWLVYCCCVGPMIISQCYPMYYYIALCKQPITGISSMRIIVIMTRGFKAGPGRTYQYWTTFGVVCGAQHVTFNSCWIATTSCIYIHRRATRAPELLKHCIARKGCTRLCRLGASAHKVLMLMCELLQTPCSHSLSLIRSLAKNRLATLVDATLHANIPAYPIRMAARLLHSLRRLESI